MTVEGDARCRWSEVMRLIGAALLIVLAVVTVVATIGALCEMLYGSSLHALLLMIPFVVVTAMLSRWLQRRR